MQPCKLREVILKAQGLLNDEHRQNLLFSLGDAIPRRIREDPSPSGILKLMDFLFDQDLINENDCNFLIKAYTNSQCVNAAKLFIQFMDEVNSNKLENTDQPMSHVIIEKLNINNIFDEHDKVAFAHEFFEKALGISSDMIRLKEITKQDREGSQLKAEHSESTKMSKILHQTNRLRTKLKANRLHIIYNVISLTIIICLLIPLFWMKRELKHQSQHIQNLSMNLSKCNRTIQNFSTNMVSTPTDQLDLDWINAENGHIPNGAIEAGLEDNRKSYIGRTRSPTAISTIGKVLENSNGLEYPHYGVHNSSKYQILINLHAKITWKETKGGYVPEGAVFGTKEDWHPVYVGRKILSSNMIIVGKFLPTMSRFYYSLNGTEQNTDHDFEVLCRST